MRPKTPPLWLMLMGVALPALVAVALYRYANWNDVDVVNGLPVPVKVTLDGQTLTVPGGGGRIKFLGVRTGTQLLEATTEGGATVESRLGVIDGHRDTVVYNVAGAAPVVMQRVEYSSRSKGREPFFEVLCGKRLIHYPSIDYRFVQPPRSISVKAGSTVVKTSLVVESGGLEACESFAMQNGKAPLLAQLQALQSSLSPQKSVWTQLSQRVERGDEAGALALAEQELARAPDMGMQRIRQDLMVRLGRHDAALAQYQARAQKPDAIDVDVVLHARRLPTVERLRVLTAAFTRFPGSVVLAWAAGGSFAALGEHAKALEQFERAGSQGDADLRLDVLEGRVEALVHLGRLKDAQALAKDFEPPEGRDLSVLQLRADLAQLVAAQDARVVSGVRLAVGGVAPVRKGFEVLWKTRWVQALTEASESAPVASDTRDVDVPVLKAARGLVRVAYKSPAQALQTVATVDDVVLTRLPPSVLLLLLTEAWRTGDATATARLEPRCCGLGFTPLPVLQRFLLEGTLEPGLEMAGSETLATLWFARGRRLQSLGAPADAALAKAAQIDVLHRTATRAMGQWPRPSSAGATAKLWVPAD